MLVHEEDAGPIEHVAVAFRRGFQLRDEIGEFLYVPAADIAEDALAVGAIAAGRFAIGMGVIVMAGGG